MISRMSKVESKNIYRIKIDKETINKAIILTRNHIKADERTTPKWQTNEWKNKMIGYIGHICFINFLKYKYNIEIDLPTINMDSSPDDYDIIINNFKIDLKTVNINEYWFKNQSEWSEEVGDIQNINDFINKFFFLIPQIQLGINDSNNSSKNYLKCNNYKKKDIYWSIFTKFNSNSYDDGYVYIIGWIDYDKVLYYNDKNSLFSFKKSYHTNIKIPLIDLYDNDYFFDKFLK